MICLSFLLFAFFGFADLRLCLGFFSASVNKAKALVSFFHRLCLKKKPSSARGSASSSPLRCLLLLRLRRRALSASLRVPKRPTAHIAGGEEEEDRAYDRTNDGKRKCKSKQKKERQIKSNQIKLNVSCILYGSKKLKQKKCFNVL
jgi:hypothetical protein